MISNYFFIPLCVVIAITIICYLINPKQYKFWEVLLPIIIVFLTLSLVRFIVLRTSINYFEYWGSTIISIYEEEPWNEWIVETCSESYPCGSDKDGNIEYCTSYYDCSYRDDHGPKWWAITDLNEKILVSESYYDLLFNKFNSPQKTIYSRTNYNSKIKCYHSKGSKFENKNVGPISNIYEIKWDNKEETRQPITSKHTYKNKIKRTDLSKYNIEKISKEKADSLGLYDYPSFCSESQLNYPTIIGEKLIQEDIQYKFRQLNGKFGVSNQLRLWILIFDNKPESYGKYQEDYWVRGNKNELVICIGKSNDKINWVHSFSWAENKGFTKSIGEILYVLNDRKLNEKTWYLYYDFLNKNLEKFKRREFKEYENVKVELSKGFKIFSIIFAIIISLLVNYVVSTNSIHNKY